MEGSNISVRKDIIVTVSIVVITALLMFYGMHKLKQNLELRLNGSLAALEFFDKKTDENYEKLKTFKDVSGMALAFTVFTDKASPQERGDHIVQGLKELPDYEAYQALKYLDTVYDEAAYKASIDKAGSDPTNNMFAYNKTNLSDSQISGLKTCAKRLEEKFSSFPSLKALFEIYVYEQHSCSDLV